MKTLTIAVSAWLVGITASFAAPKDAGNLSQLIVGQWMIHANPPRFPKYLADGTWTLMYLGDPTVQTGKWKISANILTRNYAGGIRRQSEILKLTDSEMILRTQGQVDKYRRLKEGHTWTGPAKIAQ